MNPLEKNALIVVVLLLGGLGLYVVLTKQTGAQRLALPANRYTGPNTGGTVAGNTAAFTNSFATLYKLFSPSPVVASPFTDTSTLPGGTAGGAMFGPPSPVAVGAPASADPFAQGVDVTGVGFDTSGSIADSSFDPSTMDSGTGVTGDSAGSLYDL